MDRVMILGIGASLAALIFILELVRQKKLREDYSLLWLATGLVLLILSLSRPLLDQLAALIGVVTYPPAALFAVAIFFLLALLLHFSTVLTRITRENKRIAQQMAILQQELEQTRRALRPVDVGEVGRPRENQDDHHDD
ncbi:MAG: DUF2304 domain-containing protein [Anaerolinea sp.]|nr:DUF2304 domain-containing protein [Anaerolinea sp.]